MAEVMGGGGKETVFPPKQWPRDAEGKTGALRGAFRQPISPPPHNLKILRKKLLAAPVDEGR